ncbi:MAG: hypothetical protein M3O02_02585 [Acidobacteriota bacterium]|nr:hypothetical protein [Acidobacteriota bacterium]
MTDSIVLVCAVLGCLASGVLMAYGVCVAVLRVFLQMRTPAATAAQAIAATAPQAVQG